MKGKIGIMATKHTSPSAVKSPTQRAAAAQPFTADRRALVSRQICEVLSAGESLEEACRRVPGAPHPSSVMAWVEKDPQGFGREYAHARERGYTLLGDRIERIAAETHSLISVQAQDQDGNPQYEADGVTPRLKQVIAPLSSDVIASKRLQVDTLKWKLSKMLPKVYGDKITTEHTGPGGGPVQIAALDLKNLSDAELAQMQDMLSRSSSVGGAK
jgi:hypothetical protein